MPPTKQISKYWKRTRRRKFAMQTQPEKEPRVLVNDFFLGLTAQAIKAVQN